MLIKWNFANVHAVLHNMAEHVKTAGDKYRYKHTSIGSVLGIMLKHGIRTPLVFILLYLLRLVAEYISFFKQLPAPPLGLVFTGERRRWFRHVAGFCVVLLTSARPELYCASRHHHQRPYLCDCVRGERTRRELRHPKESRGCICTNCSLAPKAGEPG